MVRARAVEADAPEIEGDRVEVDLRRVGVDPPEVEGCGADDALLRDLEREIEREVLDLERSIALEVAGAVREREGARAGGGSATVLVVTRGGAASGVQTVRDGHGSGGSFAEAEAGMEGGSSAAVRLRGGGGRVVAHPTRPENRFLHLSDSEREWHEYELHRSLRRPSNASILDCQSVHYPMWQRKILEGCSNMKHALVARSLVALAPLVLAACSGAPGTAGTGSAGGSSTTTAGSGAASTSGAGAASTASPWVLATYHVSYDAKTNTLTMTDTTDATAQAKGVRPEAFGPVTRGPQKLQISNGANSGADATCGDTEHNIPAQANSFCTSATLTNNSNNYNNLVWIELSDMSPSSVTVAQAGIGDSTDTPPPALSGLVDQTTGALNYGNIGPTLSSTREWVFRNVGTTNFTFEWTLLAAPSYSSYSLSLAKPTFVDACTISGNDQQLFPGDNFDVTPSSPLPFPVTIFNVAGTGFSLTADGVVSLDPNFEQPNGPDPTNSALPASGEGSGTLFAFWTSQVPRDGAGGDLDGSGSTGTSSIEGQVCTVTEGTAPNRIFDVTWENMRVFTEPSGASSDQDTLYSYTARFHETTDYIELQYDVMNDAPNWVVDPPTPTQQTLTSRSRGGTATIGFQGTQSTSGCTAANACEQYTFDTAILPGTTAGYPRGLTFKPGTSN